MAGSVNKVILIGNVGADPEIRQTQAGKPIANLRIATSETWKDSQTGERREKTEWHTVVVFNEGLAKIVEQYVHKGDKIYIEGALQTRKWQDQEGKDRYSTEVVLQGFNSSLNMLSSPNREGGDSGGDHYQGGGGRDPNAGNGGRQDQRGNYGGGGRPGNGGGGSFTRDLDDDIPFAPEFR